MGVEVAESVLPQVSLDTASGEISSLVHEKESGKINQGRQANEPIKFGSHGANEPVNGEANTGPGVSFPKDAMDEWPATTQIHSFYFIKYRSYEDQKLKAKLEEADRRVQKQSKDRYDILEKIKAKRADRAEVAAQIVPLDGENKQFKAIFEEKKKEIEPLQQALGKLRGSGFAGGEKSSGLCSSEEELNDVIKSLQYRMQHESIPLTEEKRLIREIKQLEGTREKVIANSAMRAKIQESLGEKDAIQDQVKLMGVDLDVVKKEKKAVAIRLGKLIEEKNSITEEIKSLEGDLEAASRKREEEYEKLHKLWKERDQGNACFFANRTLLNKARELAAKKDIRTLKEIYETEVKNFMSSWNCKEFREDYERRILQSLDIRQLSRDGRMRNPDEKPLVMQEAPTLSQVETANKGGVRRPKEEVVYLPKTEAPTTVNVQKEVKSKPQKEAKSKQAGSGTSLEPVDSEDKGEKSASEKLQKEIQSKGIEVDEAKLKEMKREEEIAKAKHASERKKKQAEKTAARAAIKAQKEAEKKLKEREKKARKKAAASSPAPESEEQPAEADGEIVELEKPQESVEAPFASKNKDRKENIRNRSRPKGSDSLPRAIPKRKKSTNYWVWAVPAALAVLMLLVIGYNYLL